MRNDSSYTKNRDSFAHNRYDDVPRLISRLNDSLSPLPGLLHLHDVLLRQLLGRVGVRESSIILRAHVSVRGRSGSLFDNSYKASDDYIVQF